MRKIPTIFERDWEGDRSRVLDVPTAGCEWVFAGEGVATRKYDGTACAVIDGTLYKRHAIRVASGHGEGGSRGLGEQDLPDGFVQIETEHGEDGSAKLIGWLPVGEGPEDRWAGEALILNSAAKDDGTYELCGPKVQGNPEGFDRHYLVAHAHAERMDGVVLTFDGIREVLAIHNVEGIVWHHPDGRMAKIKGRDFGIRRAKPVSPSLEVA